MGSVERVLVLGIVVVIVAILGIAIWGATGDDVSTVTGVVADGGTAVPVGAPAGTLGRLMSTPTGAPQGAAANPAAGAAAAPDAAAGGAPSAVSELDRWKQLVAEQKAQRWPETAGGVKPAPGEVPLKSNGAANSAANSGVQPGALAVDDLFMGPVTPAATAPRTHKVVKGDSIWKIAVRHYGDGSIQENIDAILAANPKVDASNLRIGTELVMPARGGAATVALAAGPAKIAATGERLYEVKSGDTLSTIASRQLGSTKRWQEIYDLNRDRIKDPAKVFPGTTLKLPN